MKGLRSGLPRVLLLCSILIIGSNATIAQNSKKDRESARTAEVEALIQSKNFVFKAQSSTPMAGRFIQLTSEYDVRVNNDTLATYLPYFGRAFVAPIDPTRGGIRFNSTDFEYNVEEKRKGGWEILMKPRDTRDVRQLLLTVTESGYATLQVISNDRQPITFNGFIAARESKRR